jgi:hypothetical protein
VKDENSTILEVRVFVTDSSLIQGTIQRHI